MINLELLLSLIFARLRNLDGGAALARMALLLWNRWNRFPVPEKVVRIAVPLAQRSHSGFLDLSGKLDGAVLALRLA